MIVLISIYSALRGYEGDVPRNWELHSDGTFKGGLCLFIDPTAL
jgi:hypothetical protein